MRDPIRQAEARLALHERMAYDSAARFAHAFVRRLVIVERKLEGGRLSLLDELSGESGIGKPRIRRLDPLKD